MSEPFVGEIRMFGGNFAPQGWALCDGQLLPVSQNDALFSLLGTIYGGDGRTTFGLPDLRGRIPIHAGQGPGLGPYPLGAKGGAEAVTVTANQLPLHSHPVQASPALATLGNPGGAVLAETRSDDLYLDDVPAVDMAPTSVGAAGGSQPHTNLQPFLCVTFVIALFGIYPSRF
jgi:microcystin-dependent protein